MFVAFGAVCVWTKSWGSLFSPRHVWYAFVFSGRKFASAFSPYMSIGVVLCLHVKQSGSLPLCESQAVWGFLPKRLVCVSSVCLCGAVLDGSFHEYIDLS
jgi:hypothetical protein